MDGRPVLVLVGLVALAGCAAAPFGGGSSESPTETLTPVPVSSTEELTSARADRPPGLRRTGTVDTDRLRRAHEAFLDGRSYGWRLTYDVADSSEFGFDQGFTRRAVVDGDRFFVDQVNEVEPLNQSLYVDESGGYLRVADGNETRNETLRDPGPVADYVPSGLLVERYLSGVTTNASVVERSGETYYRLHASMGRPPAIQRLQGTISDYRVTAYVTPEGFVRSMVVSYNRTWSTGSETVFLRFDYSGVDATSVEEPDWVGKLDPPTPTPTARTPTPDGTTPADTPTPDGTSTQPAATATPTAGGTVAGTPTATVTNGTATPR